MALAQKNPSFAEKIQKYIPNDLPEIKTTGGQYNLWYKNRFIHNEQNPLAESNEIFAQTENTPVSIHLVYGLGLGYLFQIATLKSKGIVILYETDLNIIWLAFTLVDFSKDILKKNIYFANTFDDVVQIMQANNSTRNKPQILSLTVQRELDTEGFDDFVRKMQNSVGSFILDLKYTKEKFYPSLQMLIQNIPSLIEEPPFLCLKDLYKGKTAVVVSAGPTLDRNIDVLKENRDKFVLFTVGTALKTLYHNGLKPDFLVLIETYNSSKQLEGLDLSDVYFITEPNSNPALRSFNFKQRFSHISANTPINHFWAELCGENIEEYWSKGSVSYTALNCARILGCSKIILVGQDLAYIEGQCYSKDSAYKDLICGLNPETNRWEIMAKDFDSFANAISASENKNIREETARRRLANLNKSLHLVKGINGDMIPTESVYAAFVAPLEAFAKTFNDREYINTSLVGAQLNGYKNLALKEALIGSSNIEKVTLNVSYNYDKELISKTLNDKANELNFAYERLEEGKKLVKNLTNELKRYKSLNVEVLNLLKKVSVIYMNLTDEFTKKSKLFDFISVGERIDIDYEIKMTQQLTLENTISLSEKLRLFFEKCQTKIVATQNLIRGVNEGFNTKS